jgi:hypothetical protein
MLIISEYLLAFMIFLYTIYSLLYNRIVVPRINMAKQLIRQSARWYKGYQNDRNPLIAVLHCNYSLGYWWATKDIFTEEEINKAFSSPMERVKFEQIILKAQDDATKQAVEKCPEYTDALDFMSKIAGEG